jgi:hypothetical protein
MNISVESWVKGKLTLNLDNPNDQEYSLTRNLELKSHHNESNRAREEEILLALSSIAESYHNE